MAQHDYDIANAAGATVRADLNNLFTAIATLNSGATAPSTTFANMIWFDTANNLLKIRDNSNANWIVMASKSGTTWIPYRAGVAIGTAALLATDTDTALAANSDSKAATQKAVKAYADAIAANAFKKDTASEFDALTQKTALADTDRFLIEDSEDSDNKKYVEKSDLATQTSEEFNVSGTFTPPAGVSLVYVTMCGGGGGGSCQDGRGGGGGGGAGGCINFPVRVIAGNNYAVTVGNGGDGHTGSKTGSGDNGVDSVFVGEDITITGGGGNGSSSSGVPTPGGNGGTFSSTKVSADGAGSDQLSGTSGADGGGIPLLNKLAFNGGDGGDSNSDNSGGAGGGGSLGPGGDGGDNGGAGVGNNGILGGGGGGGGEDAQTAGNGGPGFVKVSW